MLQTLRASWRLLRFLASLTWHAIPLWIRAARGPIDWAHHQAVRQRFARSAMRILGIDLHVDGEPYRGGACVYASNHRSWLDPFVDLAVVWAFPVAKAEVGSLPIVAAGARATGILFVDRASKDSRRVVIEEMVRTLREGKSILIYPEGTTSTEPATKTFQRGAFLVASQAGVPVVPLAIVYPRPDYHWGDGESLWRNFVQVAGQRRTRLRLMVGAPMDLSGSEDAAGALRAVIDAYILAHTDARYLATPPAVAQP